MDKIATCFEGVGNESVDSGGQLSMILMMQEQMSQQQQMQQFQSMQQFHQSMQNQIQAMEHHAKKLDKILRGS